uniref:G domain-containing protein n=1 Tax=Panagrolaimus superbus TaxID=310955 RepID=A0A914XVY5_9BILA
MSIIPTYNIILLGKTGVGKSTFVNSIANYSTYDSLEEAIEVNEPQGVIPVSFEITLKNFKKIKITQLGCNRRDVENENLNTKSSSCTQEPRVYSFYNENVGFNVIDIPGMGDTAGPTQDARNIQIIMEKLSQFTVIHGIFIMLKAFEPRLTADVKYNLNATLMMLHANAIPNIMFIITTSRGADYNPGETMTTLEDYVANLEASNGIKIELSENTVFCMDNEAYKFQCGWNKSDEYRKEFGPLIKNYSKSWDISSAAFFKLFERMYTMQGHHVQLSCAIGHARTIIHCLIGPLAAITALIQQALSPASREANIKALTKNGQQIKDEIEVQDTSSRTVYYLP